MKVRVLNLDNLKEYEEELNNIDFEVIEGEGSVPVVLRAQQAKKRSGSANTKLMSEVSGTTKKPHSQKHMGAARQGSKRSVQFVGGRTCFGPRPRDFEYNVPKKIVKKALSFVLKDKILDNKLILIEGADLLKVSTKDLNKKLKDKNIENCLVAYGDGYENFLKSFRNIKNTKAIIADALNVLDVVSYDFLLLDKKAFEQLKNEVL